jgi:hypothetical protein
MDAQTELVCSAYEAVIARYQQMLDLEVSRAELVVNAVLAVGDVRTIEAIGGVLRALRPLEPGARAGVERAVSDGRASQHLIH